MKCAEYYIKQNVLALNIQHSIEIKSPISELATYKRCFINHVTGSVIIKRKKKEKKLKNFCFYKIQLHWFLNDIKEKHACLKKKGTHEEKVLPTTDNNEESVVEKVNDGNNNVTNVNYDISKILNNGKSKKEKENKLNNYYIVINTNIPFIPKTSIFFDIKNFANTAKTILYENEQEEELRKINIKRQQKNSCHDNLMKETSNYLKDLSLFEKLQFCRYICVPSALSLKKVHIKSFHLLLKNEKQLTLSLLLNISVDRCKDYFFNKNENVELNKIMSIDNNVLFCRKCNNPLTTYSKNSIFMPHLDLNVNSFFENAFCEECTFSCNSLKSYADDSILVYPNSLVFNFDLVIENNLAIRNDTTQNFRNVLFCHSCHNSVGYWKKDEKKEKKENENGYSRDGINYLLPFYIKNTTHNPLKDILFNIDDEENKIEYIKLDKNFLNSTKVEKENENTEQITSSEVECVKKRDEKTERAIEGKNGCKEKNSDNLRKKKYSSVDTCSNIHSTYYEMKDEKKSVNFSLTLHFLKHKIQLSLNGKNIFKHYSDVVFLNEYIFNKCNKHQIYMFYIKNKEKKNFLEIKIFIKNMYICKIEENKKCMKNEKPSFHKVLKVLYCQKEQTNFIKNIKYELINVSEKIYEDVLKMLTTYAFASDIFTDKLFSYLHLVQ